jgi:predicted ATP-grasp superfamily ATP-dependent carboligase
MLRAVLEDLSRLPGMRLTTLVSASATELFPLLESLPSEVVAVEASQEASVFRDLACQADAVLAIAPEFDALLYQRALWVEQAGSRLLGPSSDAVRLAGDKLLLAKHLTARHVPTPPTMMGRSEGQGARDEGQGPKRQPNAPHRSPLAWPVVCKPRHGAGSQATFYVRHHDELASCWARAEQEGWQGELLIQPFVPGLACSVAFLMGPQGNVALPPCRQHLTDDGRFHYLGGSLPLPPDLAERAVELGRRAVEAVAGLRGYVGVDLVLGASPDGVEDVVLEINPRLTTSYVGLRAFAKTNLAEALMQVMEGRPCSLLQWRHGSVVFHADGRVVR